MIYLLRVPLLEEVVPPVTMGQKFRVSVTSILTATGKAGTSRTTWRNQGDWNMCKWFLNAIEDCRNEVGNQSDWTAI